MVTDPVSRMREEGSVSVLIDASSLRSSDLPFWGCARPTCIEADDGVERTSLPAGNVSGDRRSVQVALQESGGFVHPGRGIEDANRLILCIETEVIVAL
jgi:hypothetical protein